MRKIIYLVLFSYLLFACKHANSQQTIDQNVRCILRSLHDSDYRSFKQCISVAYSFEGETDEGWRANFIKLVSFYKASGLNINQISYKMVSPGKYDFLNNFAHVDVVIYDKNGQMDSVDGTLYGALHLGYDTTLSTGGAVLFQVEINDKYNDDYREYLAKLGKLRGYEGIDSLIYHKH